MAWNRDGLSWTRQMEFYDVLWSLLKTFFFIEIIIDKTLFLFKCLSKILSIALCNHTA